MDDRSAMGASFFGVGIAHLHIPGKALAFVIEAVPQHDRKNLRVSGLGIVEMTCVTAFELFKDLDYVVGNPFFHLRLGQASFELDPPVDRDPAGMTIDNLARALIYGGIEFFNHEDKKYLEPVIQVLRPPKAFSTWQEAVGEGCSVKQLNGVSGFLAELIAKKYGNAPPYQGP